MLMNVLGGDGCGKTTQVCHLLDWLSGELQLGARALAKRDLIDQNIFPGSDYFGTPYEHVAHQCLPRMKGESRALFLYYMNAMLIRGAPPRPGEVVIMDGYWHKHYATEAAMGIDPQWLIGMGAAFPEPDVTIVLDLDPRVIVERGHRHKPYESGCDFTCSDDAFIAHQDKVRSYIRAISKERNYPVIDANCPERELFRRIQDAVLPLIRKSRSDCAHPPLPGTAARRPPG
jgi:thymidylate kinase